MIHGMEGQPLTSIFAQMDDMPPLDRAVYLAKLRSTIHEAYVYLGATLQAALSVVVSSDLESASKAFDLPPAFLVRMAEEPNTPDVALMRRGLQAARLCPDLPFEAICDSRDGLKIVDASDESIAQIARLLCRVAEQAPLDGEVWADASSHDRNTFRQALEYARTLL
ncbi:hypothetical protein [Planomonospora algeriensis]